MEKGKLNFCRDIQINLLTGTKQLNEINGIKENVSRLKHL